MCLFGYLIENRQRICIVLGAIMNYKELYMERVKEQELLRYVVATLGEDGKVFYLQSLHWGKY